MWLFLALVAGVAVSHSHLQVGCLWPVLLALLFLVIVLGGLLLADAAGAAVWVLDPGVSASWARCRGACAWFAFLACFFLVRNCFFLILAAEVIAWAAR